MALASYLTVFAISASICLVILALRDRHWAIGGAEDDAEAVQAAHKRPTPRIGGLALIVGLVATIPFAPDVIRKDYALFTLSLGPVFLAGLAEDFRFGVSPAMRLVAAALSSALAIWLLGVWIPRVGVPGVDYLIAWAPLGIAFTIFATAGICNAFNLIDGLNGLSAGTGVITALGLALVAQASGDPVMVKLSFMLIAALMGFLVFNYPWGKIFLGDAGAYSLGHVLAWYAIALMLRDASVTPWAMVLIFFWPIADTFLAIYRRRAQKRPTGQPDRLHYHQLVMRSLEIWRHGPWRREITNPLSTLVLLPLIAAPVLTGVLLWNQPLWAFKAVVGYGLFFTASYVVGVRIARSAARKSRSGHGRSVRS